MNFRILIFPSVIVAFAAPVCQAQSKADRKEIKQLQADIAYLASDELEGRRTGSAGERKAADYIEQRYKDEGVSAYKNKYEYPFHFVYGKDISGATQIKIGARIMRIPEEAFPLPYSAGKHVYGDILPDVMEEGNIWMVALYNEQAEADDPHFDWRRSMHDRGIEAEKEGATGILFYDGFGSKWPPVFDGQSEYESLSIPAAFLSHDAYRQYIQENNITDNHDEKGGFQVDLNIAIKKSERMGMNIAAYIDNKTRYTVIIGAHYDHLGRGEDGNGLYTSNDHAIHNGADDNASGTAALLEIAGWVKKSRLRRYNYLFINFSGKEVGLLGSRAFVKDEKIDSANIAYMINMDMVGRLDSNTHTLTVGGVGTSPAWEAIVDKPDKELKIVIDNSDTTPSDQASFYNAGIPVLYFCTGTHHKPHDKADNINYTGELQVIKYLHSVITKLNKSPKPAFAAIR